MSDKNGFVAGAPAWLDLMTPEPEKARKFYAAVFGWEYDVGPAETGFYAMAKVRGRNVGGIGSKPPGATFPSVWTLYFDTKDIAATVARVKELGGGLMMGPMDVMDAGKLAAVSDPVGAVFGLWQPGNHHGAQVVNEPGAMCWHELYARGMDKAKSFYAGLFGYTYQPMTLPTGESYAIVSLGDGQVCGMMEVPAAFPKEVPSHWVNYFAVADCDAAVARVREGGGQVVEEGIETPYGRMAVVRDPWGAVFSVIKLAQPG